MTSVKSEMDMKLMHIYTYLYTQNTVLLILNLPWNKVIDKVYR